MSALLTKTLAVICPACDLLNAVGATRCRACGAATGPSAAAAPSARPEAKRVASGIPSPLPAPTPTTTPPGLAKRGPQGPAPAASPSSSAARAPSDPLPPAAAPPRPASGPLPPVAQARPATAAPQAQPQAAPSRPASGPLPPAAPGRPATAAPHSPAAPSRPASGPLPPAAPARPATAAPHSPAAPSRPASGPLPPAAPAHPAQRPAAGAPSAPGAPAPAVAAPTATPSAAPASSPAAPRPGAAAAPAAVPAPAPRSAPSRAASPSAITQPDVVPATPPPAAPLPHAAEPPRPSFQSSVAAPSSTPSGPRYGLIVLAGSARGQRFKLAATGAQLGRSKGIVLFPEDAYVSPLHGTLLVKDGKLSIRDENSTSGIFVSVNGQETIPVGGMFSVGSRLFRYAGAVTPTPPWNRVDVSVYGAPLPNNLEHYVLEEILVGGRPGRSTVAPGPTLTIGQLQCTLSFPNDDGLAPQHAELALMPGGAMIRDLSAGLGTFVRIAGERALKPGERLRIGQQTLQVEELR